MLQLFSFTPKTLTLHTLFSFMVIALSKVIHYSDWEAKMRGKNLEKIIRLKAS